MGAGMLHVRCATATASVTETPSFTRCRAAARVTFAVPFEDQNSRPSEKDEGSISVICNGIWRRALSAHVGSPGWMQSEDGAVVEVLVRQQ
jgi:hypothetical protein